MDNIAGNLGSDTGAQQGAGAVGIGKHLVADLYGGQYFADAARIEIALRECAARAGATILEFHSRVFTSGGGVSAIAVLAESHLSLHTWPELGFAAFDAFMCGSAEPERCLDVLEEHFKPEHSLVNSIARGISRRIRDAA